MDDPFLVADAVRTDDDAMRESLKSSLQRNKVYRDWANEKRRLAFRTEWAKLLRAESKSYLQPNPCKSDVAHCEAINRIADSLSRTFGEILVEGELRYGTSQKALNLYLKYLWRLGKVTTPPHCPVDGIVLGAASIQGSWTRCNSEREYMQWVNTVRLKANPLSLSEWEYQIWQRLAIDKRTSVNQMKCS